MRSEQRRAGVLSSVALVALGGSLGVAARLALTLLLPEPGGVPVATVAANLSGAFLLGLLAARLAASSRRRLFLGAGLLGGFTTYSALAVGGIELWERDPLLAVVVTTGSVILGIALAAAGLAVATPRRPRPEGEPA